MSIDDFLRGEVDRTLTLRMCRWLLLSPLLTVPLTLAIGASWLDSAVPLVNRTAGDVVMLHLPGLANLYPAWRLLRRSPRGRLSLTVAAVGLLTYLWPNGVWLVVLGAWRRSPPLDPDPLPLVTLWAHSGWYSLVLWFLALSLYSTARRRTPGPRE